jgi:hypothetical protein
MSKDPILDKALRLQTGAVAPDGAVMVVALETAKQEARIRHAHLLLARNGDWLRVVSVDFMCVRVTWCDYPTPYWVVLGEQGSVVTVTYEGNSSVARIFPDGPQGTHGLMRSVRQIGRKVVAVGMRHQVYMRPIEKGSWTDVRGEMSKWPKLGPIAGFESVDGFVESEIYAVGWEGEIALLENHTWSEVSAPTNLILTAIKCAPDESAYACGQRGLIVRGRGHTWSAIHHSENPEDYWDLAWYGGKLYVSSLSSVYTLENDELQRVDMGDAVTESCYHLSTAGAYLCSVGANAIGIFNGQTWQPVALP